LLAEVGVLGEEAGGVGVVVAGAEIDEVGVGVVFLAGEGVAVGGGAELVLDLAPGVELVADRVEPFAL